MNYVLVIAGQSNALGVAPNPISISEVASFTPARTRVWVAGSGWQMLDPYDIAQTQCDATQHGYEAFFSYLFEQKYPNDNLYIIKRARGGSPLANDPAYQDWSLTSGELFDSFCDDHLTPAFASAELATFKPLGFWWMQGESDALTGAFAVVFESNLSAFFAELHSAVPQMAKFHNYIGRVKNLSTWTYKNYIRTPQENLCAMPGHYTLVDTDETPLLPQQGEVHYSDAGMYGIAKTIMRHATGEGIGIWTPSLLADVTNPTVTFGERVGRFARSGNLVNVSFRMEVTGISGGSGNALLGGMPFVPCGRLCGSMNINNVTLPAGRPQLFIDGSTRYTAPYLMACGSGVGWTSVPLSGIQAGAWLVGSMTFPINGD